MAIGPSLADALFFLTLLISMDSTTPILRLSLSGITNGVPTLNEPAITFTPIIIGAFLLKTASFITSSAQGKIAPSPPLSFLAS